MGKHTGNKQVSFNYGKDAGTNESVGVMFVFPFYNRYFCSDKL